jgi:hypothetical protein
MKFRDLQVGSTFDWISPNHSFNSFFLRCKKLSARKYNDSTGQDHRVGSINAEVYHVGEDVTADVPAVTVEIPAGPKSWAPEVIADNSGKWVGNALRFATREEAQANVENLMYRWTLVREIRVVESNDEPNYRWIPGKGLEAIK